MDNDNMNEETAMAALAASLGSFSSGLIENIFDNFYRVIIDYTEKDKETSITSSSGEQEDEVIELSNGVKFTWDNVESTGVNFWDYVGE